jgi:hypothetical protein
MINYIIIGITAIMLLPIMNRESFVYTKLPKHVGTMYAMTVASILAYATYKIGN